MEELPHLVYFMFYLHVNCIIVSVSILIFSIFHVFVLKKENVIKHLTGSTKKCHYDTEMVVFWKLNTLTNRQRRMAMLDSPLLDESLNLK